MLLHIKTILCTGLACCCICAANAQQIKLPAIYAGEDVTAPLRKNMQGNMHTLQLQPVASKQHLLPALTPRYLNLFCISHDAFLFTKFEATRHDDATVKLAFETNNEYRSRIFTVERAFAAGTEHAEITQPADTSFQLLFKSNGLASFARADSTFAKNRGAHTTGYQLTDDNSFTGIAFYRITEIDTEDSSAATQIIAVVGKPLKETIGVYPNPVSYRASVQVFSKYAGAATLQLVNLQGTVLKQLPLTLTMGTNNLSFPAEGLAKGMYYIRVLRTSHTPLQVNMVKL